LDTARCPYSLNRPKHPTKTLIFKLKIRTVENY